MTIRPRRNISDKPLNRLSPVACESGHQFWIDKEQWARCYGSMPSVVTCPMPRCVTPKVKVG